MAKQNDNLDRHTMPVSCRHTIAELTQMVNRALAVFPEAQEFIDHAKERVARARQSSITSLGPLYVPDEPSDSEEGSRRRESRKRGASASGDGSVAKKPRNGVHELLCLVAVPEEDWVGNVVIDACEPLPVLDGMTMRVPKSQFGAKAVVDVSSTQFAVGGVAVCDSGSDRVEGTREDYREEPWEGGSEDSEMGTVEQSKGAEEDEWDPMAESDALDESDDG